MKVFSRLIHIEPGQPLGGYAGERLSVAACDELELNGLAFTDAASGRSVELCTIDALYVGELVDDVAEGGEQRIFAASHTHYAPMLDARKPQLGAVSAQALAAWRAALRAAPRRSVEPSWCTIWRAEVPVPIYRRFDVPDSALNRWLAGRAGMFPNPRQPIDRHLYLFELGAPGRTDAVIALHACHPVSRADRGRTSADYIGALRRAVRARFGDVPCLFLLGCSGDIRPDFARKRVAWLPRNRFNWRFEWPVQPESEQRADQAYAQAVAAAQPWQTLALDPDQAWRLSSTALPLVHQPSLRIPCLTLGERLRFEFVPFEVSHLFHLDIQQKDPMRFIVSCADRTLGYMPHPRQIAAGGYEVDGSRDCMGLADRVLLQQGGLW